MGAMLAGTTRSPLLAMIMAFEISLDYSLMPALMLACVVSVLVARQLHGESIYTEHMRLKGLSLQRESEQTGVAMDKTVGDLMRAPIPPLRETTTFRRNRRPVSRQFRTIFCPSWMPNSNSSASWPCRI